MALNISGILDVVISHAMASGHFERVNGHEPQNAPGRGLTAAVWVDGITAARTSGLGSASARLIFNVRLYTSAIQEPADAIDPNLLTATDALLRAYVGDFDLGGTVRQVDVFGQHGAALEARAGYIQQDGALLRVITITLPVIVNDLWDEVA
ncbi:hypothetical protein I5Q34_32920 [Streptomyces sp. AV19]|uniref:hypothetical protein n=1 Tax=Streptomyces sp. AV19 TaxID=2793068 RepID=UPI0018FEA057|nr:hypothetical protein [Streptomyces sp. AV19]MBH1939007.1 hypothetical protein [Streptomyces sp. AV19]MDG4531610.1 hypothetical protein [Streptomyces sp. AV19]